jgi:hypothetical protein
MLKISRERCVGISCGVVVGVVLGNELLQLAEKILMVAKDDANLQAHALHVTRNRPMAARSKGTGSNAPGEGGGEGEGEGEGAHL